MKRESKKEIKIYSVERDGDGRADVLYLEFVLNGMSVGSSSATLTPEGEVSRLSVYEDLDGDGKVDVADQQIMTDLATAYAHLKWSSNSTGKKEIQIQARDEDANGRAESIAAQFLLDGQDVGGALATMNAQGEVTDIEINADLNGDGQIDPTDKQIMKNIALAYAQVKWPY